LFCGAVHKLIKHASSSFNTPYNLDIGSSHLSKSVGQVVYNAKNSQQILHSMFVPIAAGNKNLVEEQGMHSYYMEDI
jgi:hypothetical protein